MVLGLKKDIVKDGKPIKYIKKIGRLLVWFGDIFDGIFGGS